MSYSEAAADAELAGLPADLVAKLEGAEAAAEPEEIEIWAENWDAVRAFAAIRTQWRTQIAPNGKLLHLGLDYTAVSARLDVDAASPLWPQLQVMEIAARAALNE